LSVSLCVFRAPLQCLRVPQETYSVAGVALHINSIAPLCYSNCAVVLLRCCGCTQLLRCCAVVIESIVRHGLLDAGFK
jgi:hypothetical protein